MKPLLPESASLDSIAAALSNLCLIHCLGLPLVLTFFPVPLLALDGSAHGLHWLHWLLIGLAIPVSFIALWRGFEYHGIRMPLALAVLGFVIMAIGASLHHLGLFEQVLTVMGGLLVAAAHWRNWMGRRT